MQYYRVNIDKEETVSWRPEYEPMIEKLRPFVRAGTGLMPWALPEFRIEVDPTELDGGAVLILGQPDEPCAISGVAWHIPGELEAWSRVESPYLNWTDSDPLPSDVLPKKPTSLPWVATLVLPWMVNQPQYLVDLVHTICIVLAYTLLEENEVSDHMSESG